MVAMHDGRLWIDIERDRDIADDGITAHELDHTTTQLVEIEYNILELVLLEQVAQVLDNLSSALDVLDNVSQDVAKLVEGGWGGLQKPTGSLGVGQDPGQRLVQLVGE